MIKKLSSFGLSPSSNAPLKYNVADAASWFRHQVIGKAPNLLDSSARDNCMLSDQSSSWR